MGYSPGFFFKIGRFRPNSNVPENFTNNPVRSQKSICKHICDVCREFGPISSTCQNQPCSKPWAIAQAFWSKSADFGQFKCSRKLHEQSRTQLEIHLQAYLRRFQGLWADFQHLPKSAMFKTMGYSPGFLVEIGRFRPNSNVPENFTNNPVPSWKSICKHISDVFREFGPISSTYQNPPSSKPWAIAQAFWSKSADFGSLQILPNTSRKSLYALRNPFASILATFLGRSGRFPALTKIRLLQTHGLQPRLFGQNRPISAHSKLSRKHHEQSRTQLEIHLQAYLRRFQGVWADFQHLPKSAIFKTMCYSPGFLVKIGRFRLIPNSPEIFTKNPVRSQKSICKHLGDVFREFVPISSTCQNQPFSKPWAIAQAFWSKSADFVSLQMFPKSSRTIQYVVRNPFASIFATFLGSLGRFPALTKIRPLQNHGLKPRLFRQNRPIPAHCKCSRKLHEQSRTQLEIDLQAYLRRLQGVWAEFQHLPKSAMFKTMGYSPGFLVKIGRFRPIQMFPKTSQTIPYVVRNPFASIFATFLGSLGRFPALTKISHLQNHVLQPRLFGQNRPISADSKFSRNLHEQSRTQLEINLQASWRRFQGVCADFKHLPKSAIFKTMGYSPGFLVKIGRFRLIANVPEKFTNNPVRSQKSICKHLCDVFREFGPISSTYQNPPSSKPWAKAQAFSSKSADSGSLQMFPKTSRTIPYVVRNRFASIFATFVGSLGRIPALAKISHVQNHGLQSRLFGQNRPISANSNVPEKFTNNPVRSQKSISKHICDVFRDFGPISSTCQNQPCSKPWVIAQAFWSKSADFGPIQMFPKTSRTIPYLVGNPFASIFPTFLGSLGLIPALTKIRPLQNHGLQPRLFGQNRPISAHCKFSRTLHEKVFTHLEIHLQAFWRRFQGVLADFQHLPKSAFFKPMGYSQDFLVKIGRFRLIPNYPENFTNNPVRSQKSICKHICDVFREFGPISSTYQNQPTSKPCAIAQAFWSKSADFG